MPASPAAFVLLLAAAIAAGVLALVYLGAPLLVWLTHRQNAAPDLVPRDPLRVPSPADADFDELGPRLADLGFSETRRWTLAGYTPRVTAELCTMADRRRRALAITTVLFSTARGAPRVHSRALEFVSRTPDGRVLNSTGALLPVLFTDMGPRRIAQFPGLSDPAALLAAHERLVARDFPGAALEDPPPPDAIPGRLREAVAAMHDWHEKCGLLRRGAGGEIRLTLKGAFLQTWIALPPVKGILLRRRRAACEALLRELGLAAR